MSSGQQYRYFMISFIQRPNGQIDESCSFTRRIKNSDLNSQNVILDFGDRKVIKCTINNQRVDTDWDRMVEYYRRVYPVLIEQLEQANRPDILDVDVVQPDLEQKQQQANTTTAAPKMRPIADKDL